MTKHLHRDVLRGMVLDAILTDKRLAVYRTQYNKGFCTEIYISGMLSFSLKISGPKYTERYEKIIELIELSFFGRLPRYYEEDWRYLVG